MSRGKLTQAERWACGWAMLASGLVLIVTLGAIWPGWTIKLVRRLSQDDDS